MTNFRRCHNVCLCWLPQGGCIAKACMCIGFYSSMTCGEQQSCCKLNTKISTALMQSVMQGW